MTKVARCVAGSNMSRRGEVAMSILAVLAGDSAEITHVSTRQILAIEGFFWSLGLNGWQIELVIECTTITV